MSLTEEQRAAMKIALTYIPYWPSTRKKHWIREVLRAMIDSRDHVTEPTKMFPGFDLENARADLITANKPTYDYLEATARVIKIHMPGALAEIERLRASLIDLHAEYINTLEKNPEYSAWDLDEQSDADQTRLRRNAAHAISIVEPPIYLQAEQRATKIKELKADLEQSERIIEARLDVIDQQAAQIKELEDALVEQEARFHYYAQNDDDCESWPEARWRYPELDEKYIGIARQQLQAEGKIGPGTVAPPCWQITEERKVTLSASLKVLERLKKVNTDTNHSHLDQGIDVLRAMLKEGRP